MRRIAAGTALALLVLTIAVTGWVEAEADFRHETVSANGSPKALVLYHPSRDAGFSDEVSLALAQGFKEAGLAVDRETITGRTSAEPRGHALVAVVSNTFWATPDLPTLRYLDRARFEGIATIGVMCGAGSTGRSERKLREALERSGGNVVAMRSVWTYRPNDERRPGAPNRSVARDSMRLLGLKLGREIRERERSEAVTD